TRGQLARVSPATAREQAGHPGRASRRGPDGPGHPAGQGVGSDVQLGRLLHEGASAALAPSASAPPAAPSTIPPSRKTPNTEAPPASPWKRPPASATRIVMTTAHTGPVIAPHAAAAARDRARAARAAAKPA